MDTPAPAIQFHDVYADEFDQVAGQLDWLLHGYLAPRLITLLTSQAKSGKTTLLSVLLKRLETGGQLAGLDVRQANAFVVSEEDNLHWLPRHERLHFARNVCFQRRPFGGRRPTPAQWEALLDHILDDRQRRGTALAVIDSITYFLPLKNEAEATCMMNALYPLTRLVDAGMAVLLLHHPRKRASDAELAARGSSALVGFADILIDMHFYRKGDAVDRRRKLIASSRFLATPPRLVIELDPTSTDYRSLGNLEQADTLAGWNDLLPILTAAPKKLTRQQILEAFPEEGRPPEKTVWRWLDQAGKEGLLHHDGYGSKDSPFRYWLPANIQRWEQEDSPLYKKQKTDDAFFKSMNWDKLG